MEGKKIDVYHKGIKQTIKVFDNTSEEDLTNFIKKIFHLNVNNSRFDYINLSHIIIISSHIITI